MSNMVGADVSELRELAGQFRRMAGELRSIESNLAWRIHSAPWHGADVADFKVTWDRSYRPMLQEAATELSTSATSLMAQAEQQEVASDSDGGSAESVAFQVFLRELGRLTEVGGTWGVVGRRFDLWTRSLWYTAPDLLVGAGILFKDSTIGALTLLRRPSLPREVAKTIESAERFVSNSSRSLRLLEKSGRLLGPVGIGFGAIDTVRDIRSHDWIGTVLDASGTVLTVVAMLTPAAPFLVAGAIAVGALSIAYSAWGGQINDFVKGPMADGAGKALQWASNATRSVASVANDGAKGVAEGAKRAVHAATEAVSATGRDLVTGGREFVNTIVRAPSWLPW